MALPSFISGVTNPSSIKAANQGVASDPLSDAMLESAQSEGAQGLESVSTPYQMITGNWYKSIPYVIRSVAEDDPDNPNDFFFPVNPEAVNVSTPFAVIVTPTLGGIVQEHSGPVFYNITLSGTTGVIPSIDWQSGTFQDQSNLRPLAAQDGLIPPGTLGGFGQNTINAINNIVSAVTGISSNLVSGNVNYTSGYTAFHVLYRFIWWYHTAKSLGSKQQLKFINYKDNNEYDVVVQNFSLTRDRSNPHLYRYQIQMKGWNINSADSHAPSSQPSLSDLGLDEGPSVKAQLFRVITDTKSVLNGAAGLLNAGASDFAV